MPFSQLFKFEGEYFMSMDLSGYDEHELEKMSVIADEYADDIIAGADKRAFLMEHAPCFICKYYPSTFLIDSITRSA